MSEIKRFKDILSDPDRLKNFEMLKEHIEQETYLNLESLSLQPNEEEAFRVYINMGKFIKLDALIYIEDRLGSLKHVNDEHLKRINDFFIFSLKAVFYIKDITTFITLLLFFCIPLGALDIIKISPIKLSIATIFNVLLVMLCYCIIIYKNRISFYLIKRDPVLKKVLAHEPLNS